MTAGETNVFSRRDRRIRWLFFLIPLNLRSRFTHHSRRHSSNKRVYLGKYLQLKYTVSMPEKISICLNRGREESVGNDDVSIVCARKYEMVRMIDVKAENPEGTP